MSSRREREPRDAGDPRIKALTNAVISLRPELPATAFLYARARARSESTIFHTMLNFTPEEQAQIDAVCALLFG